MGGADPAPERSGQATPPQGEVEASGVVMEPRPAAGSRSLRIDAHLGRSSGRGSIPDQTHELVARGLLSTADARALGPMVCGARIHTVTSVLKRTAPGARAVVSHGAALGARTAQPV